LPAVSSPLLTHNESVLAPPSPLAGQGDSSFIPQPPLPPADPTPVLAPAAPLFDDDAPLGIAPAPSVFVPPAPLPPAPMFTPPAPTPFTPPMPPLPPAPVAPPTGPAPAPQAAAAPSATSDVTLTQIEESVGSPHVHISDDGTFSNGPGPAAAAPSPFTQPAGTSPAGASAPMAGVVDDARSAVAAALSAPGGASTAMEPIAALNAQPLGSNLHANMPPAPAAGPAPAAAMPTVLNTGFSEPTPGNTPADDTLDMPLPSNPFGPGQQLPSPPMAPASSFPGAPASQSGPAAPPPPVPPPMFPPVQ
jgi:hypothetical protein